jgi:hypothetical protein
VAISDKIIAIGVKIMARKIIPKIANIIAKIGKVILGFTGDMGGAGLFGYSIFSPLII